MGYKKGDLVLVKSLEWYKDNANIEGDVRCGDATFSPYMKKYCGQKVRISEVDNRLNLYYIKEDKQSHEWTAEMFECKVSLVETVKERFGDDVGNLTLREVIDKVKNWLK